MKPIDLLPSARSVIVLGLRIPSGAIRANDRAFERLRHAIYSYVNFGLMSPLYCNFILT